MDYGIIPIALLFCMLIIMLLGIMLPIGARIPGKTVKEIRLSFREKLLKQRVNVYAIGFVLLMTAVTQVVAMFWEMLIVLVVLMLLSMRARYLVTSEGIAMNNVVFRPWKDFNSFEINSRGIRLLPKEGVRPFNIRLIGEHKKEMIALLRRYVPAKYASPEREAPGYNKALARIIND